MRISYSGILGISKSVKCKAHFCSSHQSSCCFSNLVLNFFFLFSPSAGYQNMQSWKSNSWTRQILFIDHCQKLWLWRRRKVHKREATMREWLALLRFKGRKKMMMKTSQALCYFQMWKRTLILSLSHFSCPAINLQMSSQRSRSKAMNNQAEKVAQSKLNYRKYR